MGKELRVFGLAMLLGGGQAFATEMGNDGNALITNCESLLRIVDARKDDNSLGAGYCVGMMHGVRSAMRVTADMLPPSEKSCVPHGISNGQTIRVVLKWLKDNPTQLDLDAGLLTYRALKESYPCR
ncbi:hypothetical protein PS850_03807 [Pseudomonas fluorescens]|nr:hypothetical protein PS850_03807 [Pseudomonas fluorescens]